MNSFTIFRDWLKRIDNDEFVNNVIGISDNDSSNTVSIYCFKNPIVLTNMKYLKDFKMRIGSLSGESLYKLQLKLVDYYDEYDDYTQDIQIKWFDDSYDKHILLNPIREPVKAWVSNYGDPTSITTIMKAVPYKRGDKIDYKAIIYLNGSKALFGDPESSVKNLKSILKNEFPKYDFKLKIYEANTAII